MGLRRLPWCSIVLCVGIAGTHAAGVLADSGHLPSYLDANLDARLALIRNGARSTALVADAGEGWRLFTSVFAHTGWVHLLLNLAFLLPTLWVLESRVGAHKTAAGTLLITCMSSLCSLAWTPEISAGASGLVFGWMGALAVLAARQGPQTPRPVPRFLGRALLPFLGISLLLSIGNPHLDHASHLGGLLTGLVLGWLLPVDRVGETARSADAWSPHEHPSAWHIAATAAAVTTLFLARMLATGGASPTTVRLVDEVVVDIPPTYAPTLDGLGRTIYQGRSSLVRLTVDAMPMYRNPAGMSPEAWVLEQRIDPLVHAAILAPRANPPASSEQALPCSRHAYARKDHPVHLSVCTAATGTQRIVVTLETPAEWTERYVPLLRTVLASVRVHGEQR